MSDIDFVQIFNSIFPEELTEDEFWVRVLNIIEDDSFDFEFKLSLCERYYLEYIYGTYKYADNIIHVENYFLKKFFILTEKLSLDSDALKAIKAFFGGDIDACLEYIREDIINGWVKQDMLFTEEDLIYSFIIPYKNATEVFWLELREILKKVKTEPSVLALCTAVNECYYSDNNETIIDVLINVLHINPQSMIAKELLGYTYYSMGMWNNALAYFEQLNETNLFYDYDLYFFMAWSYGKIKDNVNEILFYRKCLGKNDMYPNALNNLGYAYYLNKQFNEALFIFKKCVDEERDFSYSIRNYVKTLLSLGRYKDAKQFIKKSKHKFPKYIIDKVNAVPNLNTKLKRESFKKDILYYTESESDLITINGEQESDENLSVNENKTDESIAKTKISIGKKKCQFSNEKLLEDELAIRLDSWNDIFGIPLKIYRRKGEYGRQFIIPIGRLDLLAEDKDENLYIIELKKDSGYDDAYSQIVSYIEWFIQNKIKKNKKVYGIICLNNPSIELKNRIREDKRVRLFEYSISYSEVF